MKWLRFGWKWSQSNRCTVPKLSLETQRKAIKNRTAEQPAGIPTYRLPSTSRERQCSTHRRNLRGSADKSLARPGRKQATATKLGIYSTCSSRSSIHFLARCSNFCKPLKKKSESCLSNQVSAVAMTSASEETWRTFYCFSVQRTGDSPTGPDPENRVGNQDIGSPGRPVSSGLQVPGEPGHCRARTRPTW